MQNIQSEDNDEKGEFGQPTIPCVYGAWNSEKKLVECSKDFSKKGKVYQLSLETCKQCYKRRVWVKKEKGNIQKTSKLQAIYCSLNNISVKYTQVNELADKLPCLKNPMLHCKNYKCNKQILDLIGYLSKEGDA